MFDASKKDALIDIFKAVPKRKTEMQQIVELLEDKRTFEYYSKGNQYQVFCEAYMIKLIQMYVRSEDEQQILLAIYQLLDGYTDKIGVIKRRELFAGKAAGRNKLIESDWADPNSSLRKIECQIVEKFVERLTNIITDNPEKKGWLGLAEVVVKELSGHFPNGLPKELPLSSPSYLSPATVPQRNRIANPPPVEELFPTAKEIILIPGQIFELKVAILPNESVNAPLSFVSLDPSIVTVSTSGMLKAEKKTQKLLHNIKKSQFLGDILDDAKNKDTDFQTVEIVIQAESGITASKLVAVDYSKGSHKSPVEDINDFLPSFFVMQNIRLSGTTEWLNSVNAEIGDKVDIQIQYKNISEITQKNVMIRDVLPSNLVYIPGTTKLYNSNHYGGAKVDQDVIATTGINIGAYAPGANAYVRFSAKIVDVILASGSNTLVNWSQAGVGQITLNDYATAVVQKK